MTLYVWPICGTSPIITKGAIHVSILLQDKTWLLNMALLRCWSIEHFVSNARFRVDLTIFVMSDITYPVHWFIFDSNATYCMLSGSASVTKSIRKCSNKGLTTSFLSCQSLNTSAELLWHAVWPTLLPWPGEKAAQTALIAGVAVLTLETGRRCPKTRK